MKRARAARTTGTAPPGTPRTWSPSRLGPRFRPERRTTTANPDYRRGAPMSTSLAATSINPQFRTLDGLSIRYAESVGPHEPTLLLTSPWPESLYAFRRVWDALAVHARLVAIDLPGFGGSERRDDLLSPRAMGGFVARIIAEAQLDRPHIVAPDVGTSAALFAAAQHPERIASVIVGSDAAAVPLQLGEPLRTRVLDPDFDRWRRMDPRAIVGPG